MNEGAESVASADEEDDRDVKKRVTGNDQDNK